LAHAKLIERLFPEANIAVEEGPIVVSAPDIDALKPSERPAIARAVDKRQREFIAGRVMARAACARLGVEDADIPQAEDRSPLWPSGLVGSITHTKTWCAAAVARQSDYLGLGIDIEADEPLKEPLWSKILTESELNALLKRPALERGSFAKLVFCAKEAAYKAQHAITKTFLGFDAMTITADTNNDAFVARFTQSVGDAFKADQELAGRYGRADGLLAAAVLIRGY
jgi:4'-phosphopantetheinyl transferase EntD